MWRDSAATAAGSSPGGRSAVPALGEPYSSPGTGRAAPKGLTALQLSVAAARTAPTARRCAFGGGEGVALPVHRIPAPPCAHGPGRRPARAARPAHPARPRRLGRRGPDPAVPDARRAGEAVVPVPRPHAGAARACPRRSAHSSSTVAARWPPGRFALRRRRLLHAHGRLPHPRPVRGAPREPSPTAVSAGPDGAERRSRPHGPLGAGQAPRHSPPLRLRAVPPVRPRCRRHASPRARYPG